MITITQKEYNTLVSVATEIGVSPQWLVDLISFESGFDPLIKNPNPDSTARGLIQFIDDVAKELGYKDSLDLVTKNPTIQGQLTGPVRIYLNKYKPYPTKQALYMGVFYPDAQYWPANKDFPDIVHRRNPGIWSPAHYMKAAAENTKQVTVMGGGIVSGKKEINWVRWLAAAAVAAGLFQLAKKG